MVELWSLRSNPAVMRNKSVKFVLNLVIKLEGNLDSVIINMFFVTVFGLGINNF